MSDKAIFGAGCFWGVEADYRQLPGVIGTAVGYMGGGKPHPTYQDVCTDRTGHAEVVEVEYDPAQISYEKLLQVFWAAHDPTQLNRQGPDHGTQYRSAIFTNGQGQELSALKSRAEAQTRIRGRIVTEITPAKDFWVAEDYHQQYLEKRGMSSCHVGLAEKQA